jgi:hypothetical protein
LLAHSVVASPQTGAAAEYDLKAAYLYNFLKFVEWPSPVVERLDGQLKVCVLGAHPVVDVLTSSGQAKVGDWNLVIEQIHDIEQLALCQAVFIPAESSLSSEFCEEARGKAILTVTESEDGDAPIGVINLWRRGRRIVFSVDIEAAESQGLRISSRLLEVAVTKDQYPDGLR